MFSLDLLLGAYLLFKGRSHEKPLLLHVTEFFVNNVVVCTLLNLNMVVVLQGRVSFANDLL